MKYTLTFIFTLLLFVPALGQVQNVDSLENILNTKKLSIDEEFEVCKQLTEIYQNSDADKLMMYERKELKIATENKKYNASIAISLYYIGIAYHTKAVLDSAFIYYQKTLDVALSTKDKPMEISAYVSFGTACCDQGDYSKGLEYFIKALSIAESTDNKKKQIPILGNIGTIYLRFDNDDRALHYFERANELAEKENIPNGRCAAYFNIGNIYLSKGDTDKALEYEFKALEISRSIGHRSYEVGSLLTIAQIYNLKESSDYEKAEKYAKEGLVVAEKYEDPQMILQAYGILADIYFRHKHYAECDVVASKAWEMDTTNIVTGKDYVGFIAQSNIFLGNKEKASQYLNLYANLVKKVNDKSLHESLTEMEVKYETEKKELRIASLEKERQLYIWLAVTGALLVIALGILLRQRIKNEQKKRQLTAANALQEGEIGERERLASELHDRLGGTLSAAKSELKNSKDILSINDKLDVCIEEVRRITQNMMPLSLRFGLKAALEDFTAQFSNVQFHFFGEETTLNKRLEFVIYCCANELVTNSIRHSGAVEINVQLVQEENRIALTVQDNGHGFDKEIVKKGIGLKNVNDRVASCNGKIEIASTINKGTETTIEFRPEKA